MNDATPPWLLVLPILFVSFLFIMWRRTKRAERRTAEAAAARWAAATPEERQAIKDAVNQQVAATSAEKRATQSILDVIGAVIGWVIGTAVFIVVLLVLFWGLIAFIHLAWRNS